MTDLRQAAQQALAALENSSPDQYPEDAGVFYDAITTLRAALEQPEQEPVAWMYTRLKDGSSIKLVEKRAEMPEGGWSLYKEEPLYTTPPQRQWDKPGTSFNDWWNGDYDDSENPFEQDSAAYWAWAGWQGATHD